MCQEHFWLSPGPETGGWQDFGDDWARVGMLMLSSYYDRSEYAGDPHILAVAGYMSQVEIWKDFDHQWKDYLSRPEYNVPYFHMKEFTVSRKAFSHGWKGEHRKRKDFLQGLIEIIQRNTLASFATAVRVDEYNEVISGFPDIHPKNPLRSPFAYCWMDVRAKGT